MADFSEFAAFVPATLPTPSPQVNRVEELVEEICHVIKDRVEETGANEINHDKEDFKTFEGIERCLLKYRETCRNKIDEYLSELPVLIREYAEQKLLFAHKKSPGQVLQALQSRLKEVVAEFMPKLSKAYETSSLVCNYLLDPREFRNSLPILKYRLLHLLHTSVGPHIAFRCTRKGSVLLICRPILSHRTQERCF